MKIIFVLTVFSGLVAQAQNLIFTNPLPSSHGFGDSFALHGEDKVFISNSDEAYLFEINGKLLTTFRNPMPTVANSAFGWPLASLGSDKVIIGDGENDTGATNTGIAYLFDTNGVLMATFLNPTPASSDGFGIQVAGVGTDKILVGAWLDDTGGTNAGAAYLFDTNGTLLTTLMKPIPKHGDGFGRVVASVGSNKMLIGAYFDDAGATNSGAAYLFSTNGVLLTTFTNPTPATGDNFGFAIAGMGADKVLISAISDNTGATNSGSVYLFNTDGTLLTTFTNPTPADSDFFGWAVAGVGSDKLIIGAWQDDTGGTDAGAAYLFSTNGTLLNTFASPVAVHTSFGTVAAGIGADKILIGAANDDTSGPDSGIVYLIDLAPRLSARLISADAALISWSASSIGFVLQENSLAGTTNWSSVTNSVSVVRFENQITVSTRDNKFYRLFKPQ